MDFDTVLKQLQLRCVQLSSSPWLLHSEAWKKRNHL